jgi:hypothetical protein
MQKTESKADMDQEIKILDNPEKKLNWRLDNDCGI